MRRTRQNPVKTFRILSLVFGLLSLGFILAGFGILLVSNLLTSSYVRTEGTVVRMTTGSNRQAPIVDYVVSGNTYEHHSGLNTSPPSFAVGEKVTILYDPTNPQSSRIEGYGVEGLISLILWIVGGAFLIPSLIMLLLYFTQRKRR